MASVPKLLVIFLTMAAWLHAPGLRAEAPSVPYEVELRGIEDKAMLEGLRELSQSLRLKEHPPATPLLLRRRVDGDVERFRALLRSKGFFAAEVTAEIAEDTSPAEVTFRLTKGPAYRIREVRIEGAEFDFLDAELPVGTVGSTRSVIEAEQRLVRQLRNNGYPHAAAGERRVVVDHGHRAMDATFTLEPGPAARFGAIEIEGLDRVREKAVRRRRAWESGAEYSAEKMEAFRRALLETSLFATVQVRPGEVAGDDGTVPVRVSVQERKPRTLKIGAEYRSDVGFGVNADWTYRNFLRREVLLDVNGRFSEIERSGEVGLSRSYFLRPDQSVSLRLRVAEDEPDAYLSRSAQVQLTVIRDVTERLRLSGGLGVKVSEVEQGEENENYTLLLSPWSLDYNRTDDLLNPTRGGRVLGELTPYLDVKSGSIAFTRTFGEYRHYLGFGDVPGVVLAGRAAAGSIAGASRDDIPADERFYAGGGGSVRGYEYQSIGEQEDGQPLGGKALLETSLELRGRFSERWGAAAFVDGGAVYPESYADGFPFQWGAGLGLRLYTGLGPIRVDVAVPVNPRDEIDEDYQFYISLGQSF